jgi:hypothetical protein
MEGMEGGLASHKVLNVDFSGLSPFPSGSGLRTHWSRGYLYWTTLL